MYRDRQRKATRVCVQRPRRGACLAAIVAGAVAVLGAMEGAEGAEVPARLRQPEVAGLKPLFCTATPVPEQYHNQKSGYTAFGVGPDGKVYLGTARYYDYGYWLAFDPKDKSFTPAVSLRIAAGEDLYDFNTQGKTHTKLAVGPDGKIYGGTKQGHELFSTRPEIGEQSGGYPGGHLITYDPATGIAEDLGVLRAQDGLMNCIVDAQRRRIYFKTEPRTHFLIYEMDTHQVIDKGRVGTWNRYIDMDGEGNVWIPNKNRLTKYDVKADELAEYSVQVEGEGRPYARAYACVIGGKADARNMKLYGGDVHAIQEFDLAQAHDGVVPMRYVCRAAPEPYEACEDIHAMIRDKKGRIYWPGKVKGAPEQLLIMRYDPDTEKSECLGYAVDPDLEKRPDVQNHVNIQGIALGEDGTLYLMATYPYYVLEFPRLAAD